MLGSGRLARSRSEAERLPEAWLARGGGRARAAVVLQATKDLWANSGPEWAAALAFYALLSLFPLLLAAAAVASYLVEPRWAADRLADLLAQFLPRGAVEVEKVVDGAVAERQRVGLVAIVAWLVTGRRVFGALVTALDRVSDVDEQEETVRRRALVETGLLAGVGILVALALSARPLLDVLWRLAGAAPGPRDPVVEATAELLRALLLVAAFSAIYVVVPKGERVPRAALTGAVAATLLVLVARAVFSVVIGWLWDNLSLAYGPLAVAAVLLLWAWYVGLIVLFGGSLASHVKVMVVEGRTADEARRRHVARKPAP